MSSMTDSCHGIAPYGPTATKTCISTPRKNGGQDAGFSLPRRYPPLSLLTLLLVLACGILEPRTELEVVNLTGVRLEAMAAPCGQSLTPFGALDDGDRARREVSAGCWLLEGRTVDDRAGPTQIEVPDGTLRRVEFRAPTLAQCLTQTPVRSAYCKQLIARQLGGKP